MVDEVVRTEGLRRSEAVKIAVLRAVSRDLRSPLTAMIAAGAAVRVGGVVPEERDELGGLVEHEGTRLSRLIDRRRAGGPAPSARFDLALEADLPPVTADFVQLKRALANLLENATRFSERTPVAIRARRIGDRVSVRVATAGRA